MNKTARHAFSFQLDLQVVMIRDLPEYQGKHYAITDEDEKTLSILFSLS